MNGGGLSKRLTAEYRRYKYQHFVASDLHSY
jgi:hypothetical protein